MSLSVAEIGHAASTSAVNPAVITVGATGAAVGDCVIVCTRQGTITAVTDSKGNTYSKLFDIVNDGNSGTKAGVWACTSIATPLVSGDTISSTGAGGEELTCALLITGGAVSYDGNMAHYDETGTASFGPFGPITPASAQCVLIVCDIGSRSSTPTITSTNQDGVGWSKTINFNMGAGGDAAMAISTSIRSTNTGGESISGTESSPSFNQHHLCFFSMSVASVPTTGQLWPRGKKGTSPTTGQLFPRGVIQ